MGRQEKPLAELGKILRAAYPKGSRVVLVQMDDIQAQPLGTQGTVQGVDDRNHNGSLGQREPFRDCFRGRHLPQNTGLTRSLI